MTDRALSEAAMQTGLQDIRLPVSAPGGLIAEIAAGIGGGALLALVILLFLRLVTARREREAAQPLTRQIAATKGLPADARRIALLRLLKTHSPEVHARLQDRLYAENGLDTREIETEVARLV